MTMPAVYFSHGQESGPWGTKIKAMAATVEKLGCRAESVDYQGIADPTDRVNKLIAECADVEEPLVLVGSSMGGHVATAAAMNLDRYFDHRMKRKKPPVRVSRFAALAA